jgi:hypothetical protein
MRHTPRGTRTHHTLPVASLETHPKMSNSKIPCRLIKVYAYRSHSRQVLGTFKHLTHNSHRTKAHIPCSYDMSNPFKEIIRFLSRNLVSRVTSSPDLLRSYSSYRHIILVRTGYLGIMHLRFHTTLEHKCTSIHRYRYIKFEKKLGYMHRGLPSSARLV